MKPDFNVHAELLYDIHIKPQQLIVDATRKDGSHFIFVTLSLHLVGLFTWHMTNITEPMVADVLSLGIPVTNTFPFIRDSHRVLSVDLLLLVYRQWIFYPYYHSGASHGRRHRRNTKDPSR